MGKFEDTLTEEQKNLVLGTATDEDGNREDITAGRFLNMMDEYITAALEGDDNRIKGMELMHVILQSLVSLYESRPEMMESESARGTYYITKSLLPIFDSGNFAKWAPYLGFMLTAGADLASELKHPEYEGRDIIQLFEEAERDENGEPTEDSLFVRALANALQAKQIEPEAITRTTIKRAQSVEYPLDKPNAYLWKLLEMNTDGQLAFNLASSKDKKSKKDILVYYSIDFDGLEDMQITRRLTMFDKRVYIAVSALFNIGNNVITLSQIYYAMGYTGRPGTKDLSRINEAVSKMTGARIFLDNEQEATKYKYSRFRYDGSLLPLERGTVIVNGQLADAAIHIFREPPLITFAKQRGQITTIDVKCLQSPISKTEANLQIDDYLLERIARAEKGKQKGSFRILYKTLYERTGITTKKQAQRAPAKIDKYLTHYQKSGFIERFKMEKDGITIYWNRQETRQ